MPNEQMKTKLYKFKWNCGRMGDVTGLFAATQEQINAAIGKEVYFGEILGKHSEIHGTLDLGDLEELTDDAGFIAKAARFGCIPSGYNPLDYIQEEDVE